jgi:hypothetical protein
MSSPLDDRIRHLVQRAVANAPPPPRFPVAQALTSVPERRLPAWVIATAAALGTIVLIGGAAWLFSDRTTPRHVTTEPAEAIPTAVEEALWRETGSGSAFVECEPCRDQPVGGYFVEITHDGSGPFRVTAYDQDGAIRPDSGFHGFDREGREVRYQGYLRLVATGGEATPEDLAVLVDANGGYAGRISITLDNEPVAGFEVRTEGDWSIGVFRFESAPDLTRTVSGVGDELLKWNPGICDVDRMVASHPGSGRFLALSYGFVSWQVLFDEDGAGEFGNVDLFSRPLEDGECDGWFFVEVRAEGPWTLTVVEAVGG